MASATDIEMDLEKKLLALRENATEIEMDLEKKLLALSATDIEMDLEIVSHRHRDGS